MLVAVSLLTLLAWVSFGIRSALWLFQSIQADLQNGSESQFFGFGVFAFGLPLIFAAVAIVFASVALFRGNSFAIVASTVLCAFAVWFFAMPSIQLFGGLLFSNLSSYRHFSDPLLLSLVLDVAFCGLLPMWLILSLRCRHESTGNG